MLPASNSRHCAREKFAINNAADTSGGSIRNRNRRTWPAKKCSRTAAILFQFISLYTTVRGGGTLVNPSSNALMFIGNSLESLLSVASANASRLL